MNMLYSPLGAFLLPSVIRRNAVIPINPIPASLPSGRLGVAYSYQLPVGSSVTWTAGTPPGVTFDSGTYRISGTPA